MSRLLKFRAWNGFAMEYGGFSLHATGKIDPLNCMTSVTTVSPIMQYTGLKNAMEIEIWEGDKLSFTVFDCFDNDDQFEGYVVYSGSRFMVWCKPDDPYYEADGAFDLDWLLSQDDELKIIGNIYESPELLEPR